MQCLHAPGGNNCTASALLMRGLSNQVMSASLTRGFHCPVKEHRTIKGHPSNPWPLKLSAAARICFRVSCAAFSQATPELRG
jgi:hypothetical protein